MSDDQTTEIISLPPSIATPTIVQRSGLGAASLLIAFVALFATGYAVWGVYALQHEEDANGTAARLRRLSAQFDDSQRSAEQSQRESESLRARVKDADNVNKSLREEVLGLSERTRLLEDAVANLAEKRLSGHDALALNEAEMLLLLGQQRYALFHDAAATIAAYRQADLALAETDDPAFVGVRQSVAAEIESLSKLQDNGVDANVAALDRLRAQLAHLPIAQDLQSVEKNDAAASGDSRLWHMFSQFVRVSHDQDLVASVQARGGELGATMIELDISVAQSALLARDATVYREALARVRNACVQRFAATDAGTTEALAEIDKLAALPLAAAAPNVLGTALKELRNLRTTHALLRVKPPTAPASGATITGQS